MQGTKVGKVLCLLILARLERDMISIHIVIQTNKSGMDLGDTVSAYSIPKLVASVLFCVIVGSLGSLITITGPGSWYASLQKPFFTPPSWLFAPVWITLFTLMGIALYLVWQSGTQRREVRFALVAFGVQFVFNVAWSFLFFGLESPLLGLVDIVLLWIMIAVTIVLFYRVKKTTFFLLVPYIIWVSIATALNYNIYILNP